MGDRCAKTNDAVGKKLVERRGRVTREPPRGDSLIDEGLDLRFPRQTVELFAVEQELSRIEDAGLFDLLPRDAKG